MFNRNGSNNGNGSANGVHKDTAVASRNGKGHKPDAAPVSSTGQAIVTEHELLWDGLSPAVSQALGQPIDPELVSQRKGRGGKFFDYLEGHARHRSGQPHLRLWRVGLRAGRGRHPPPGSRRSTPRRAR